MPKKLSLNFLKRKNLILGSILSVLLCPIDGIAYAQTIPTTPGWHEIPNTKLRSVCPPKNFGGSGYDFQSHCSGVTGAWNSAAFDKTSNRLFLFGGGHFDYLGNEVYAINLNNIQNGGQVMERLTDPGLPLAGSGTCQEGLPNSSTTQPNSRHTYDTMVFLPSVKKVLIHGGPVARSNGNCNSTSTPTPHSRATWTFDTIAKTWNKVDDPGWTNQGVNTGTCVGCGYLGKDTNLNDIPRLYEGRLTAYDPNTNLVYHNDLERMYTFDPDTNTWQFKADNTGWPPVDYHLTAIIDPIRKKFYAFGGGEQWVWDISNGSTGRTNPGTAGGSPIINCNYPGLTYDSVADVIAGWCGGNTVWTLNPDTLVWTAHTFPGGPEDVWPANHQPPSWNTGVYKRFQYSPILNAYVLVQHVDNNIFLFRLNESQPDLTAPSSVTGFQGTVVSTSQINLSWNSATDNNAVTSYRIYRNGNIMGTSPTVTYSDTGLSPGTNYTYNVAALDSAGNEGELSNTVTLITDQASNSNPSVNADFSSRCQGSGVVKCAGFDTSLEVEPNVFVYPDGQGVIRGTLDTSIKASGAGSLRFEIPPFSSANSSGGWVDSLGESFGPGETFYVQFRQRFSQEMIETDFGGGGWKQVIFHYNGKTCAAVEITTQNVFLRGYPQMYTECGGRGIGGVDLGNGDFLYQTGDYECHRWDQNSTDCSFYHAGEWMTFYYEVTIGTWGQPDSSIKAWVAYEGKPMKQFIDETNFILKQNSPGDGSEYNKITLLPYNTHKPNTLDHPTAYTWYDELIVSTQPIPAPDGLSDVAPPAPPQNLMVQ